MDSTKHKQTFCQRFANAAIAHFIFSNATGKRKKIKRAIAPSLQTLVAITQSSVQNLNFPKKIKKQKRWLRHLLCFF
jgi:2,4-dienoyl-CoA reductase-like NADH-dependent reductase (Old Yellow Enzyme family)